MSVRATPPPRSATRRPIPITIVGWLFVVVGVGGVISSALSLKGDLAGRAAGLSVNGGEPGLVLTVRALAVVGGVLMLYGVSWARWLLVAWMAWHVVLSLWHSSGELAVHSLLLVVLLFVLLNRRASAYFGNAGAG